MAWRTLRGTLKEKSIKKDEIFQLVSARCNYLSTDIIKDVYYAFVKMIVQEMKRSGSVYLPEFGCFVLQKRKGRNIISVYTKEYTYLPPKWDVFFRSDVKLKNYLNKFTHMNKNL